MVVGQDIIRVLAVDCRYDGDDDAVGVTEVDSAPAALIALRATAFDLLLTAADVDGRPVWPLARSVRRVRPKLRWWLIARGIPADEEILARTLGVTRLLAAAPTAAAVAAAFGRPAGLTAARFDRRPLSNAVSAMIASTSPEARPSVQTRGPQ